MREVKLELSDQVVGAPQPQQLLGGVRLVGLGQSCVLRGVVLLLQLQERLDVGNISSSLTPGCGQGAHGGLGWQWLVVVLYGEVWGWRCHMFCQ